MSPVFTINFRREAFLREVARTRRRVFILGIWVAYFGTLAVLVGLYGLNCVSLTHRLRQVERQTAVLRGAHGATLEWKLQEPELGQIERHLLGSRIWHERLSRLAAITPPHVRLATVSGHPQNATGASEENRLTLTGDLRAAQGKDLMPSVIDFVAVLRTDSLFSKTYRDVKLASTQISEGSAVAEFVTNADDPSLWTAALRRHWPLVGIGAILLAMITIDRVGFRPTARKYEIALKEAAELGLTVDTDAPPRVLPPRLFALLTDNALPAAEAQEQGSSGVLTAQLIEDVTQLIAGHGIKVVTTEPGTVTQGAQSIQVRAHFRLRCRYDQFLGLLASMARTEKLLGVDRFVISADPAGGEFVQLWVSRYRIKRGMPRS